MQRKYLDEKQKLKKNGWQSSACYWFNSDLHKTHAEGERESWTRGVRTEEKKEKKNKNKRTESMLEDCARPLANPSAASFFPLFLSNSVSLFLSSSPLSVSNHWLSLCQHAEGPPIWHRVSNSPANTHAQSTEKEGRERWQREKQRGGGVDGWWLVVERGREGVDCVWCRQKARH